MNGSVMMGTSNWNPYRSGMLLRRAQNNIYMPRDSEVSEWCSSLGKANKDWRPMCSIYSTGARQGPVHYYLGTLPYKKIDEYTRWLQLYEHVYSRGISNKLHFGTEVHLSGWLHDLAILKVPEKDSRLWELEPGELLHLVRLSNGEIDFMYESRIVDERLLLTPG